MEDFSHHSIFCLLKGMSILLTPIFRVALPIDNGTLFNVNPDQTKVQRVQLKMTEE